MKKTIKLFAIILAMLVGFSANAQEKTAENKTTYSVEVDPMTYAFKGYAVHVRIKPKNSKRLLLGAGTYAMTYPDFLVNVESANKDKGWNVRITSAYSFFSEYYFKEANNKWFVGLQGGVQNIKIKNDNVSGQSEKYSNMLIMPSIGYNWRPFDNGFYVKPWLGFGYTSKVSGTNTLGTYKYKINPMVNFLTFHVGYTF